MIESKVGVEQCSDRHLPLPAGSGPVFFQLKSQPCPAPAAALVIGVVTSAVPGYKCTCINMLLMFHSNTVFFFNSPFVKSKKSNGSYFFCFDLKKFFSQIQINVILCYKSDKTVSFYVNLKQSLEISTAFVSNIQSRSLLTYCFD